MKNASAFRDFTLAAESVVNVIDLLPNGVAVRRSPIIAVIWSRLPLEAAGADRSPALLSRGNIGRSRLSRAVRWSHVERVASNCPASARRMQPPTFETSSIGVWWSESVRREVAASATIAPLTIENRQLDRKRWSQARRMAFLLWFAEWASIPKASGGWLWRAGQPFAER